MAALMDAEMAFGTAVARPVGGPEAAARAVRADSHGHVAGAHGYVSVQHRQQRHAFKIGILGPDMHRAVRIGDPDAFLLEALLEPPVELAADEPLLDRPGLDPRLD